MHKQSVGEGGSGLGGSGGCECRIEVIVKMKKSPGGPVRGEGVRVDVNEELKLLSGVGSSRGSRGGQVLTGVGIRGT